MDIKRSTITKEVVSTTFVTEDVFTCPECSKSYSSEVVAKSCLKRDLELKAKRQREMERKDKELSDEMNRLYDQMPKIPADEYTMLAILEAILYAPPIIPCLGCGRPRIRGNMCTNTECNGDPDMSSEINSDEMFEDDYFELPDDGWHIEYDDSP